MRVWVRDGGDWVSYGGGSDGGRVAVEALEEGG